MNSELLGVDAVVTFLVILFIIFWIYSVLWVAKDISWRTRQFNFHIASIIVVAVLTPLIGLPVYFLMRPAQRLDLTSRP